ncbi:MAG: bifunctional diaminohydroxyphosphoribosylaminopyrimidine deaminase/5-amino-6-(5-phosphoribosylamino)uracil reductase RibD [Saprospiraceae bacterium]|nr:bifunctional diaminohydroxyphosphoribosylaminopyrimidine deaminase/5-amino-6-(5-phosphoribosylamino)uracil reductase RibD [Candidatus Parvibacillus calidus]
MDKKHLYLQRAIDLALHAGSEIASNPPVGCVLVQGNHIIGEGWHKFYGGPHAEVNAIHDAIKSGHSPKGSEAYVSLEPCGHYGKTPPCAMLLAENRVRQVYIAEKDHHPITSGIGLKILSEQNIETETISTLESAHLLQRFYINHFEQRPYVILKFAQSKDGMMASTNRRIPISNPYSARLVHRWRSACDGILIGSGTLNTDDPLLNNRLWFGKTPHRFVIGKKLVKQPELYKMFKEPGKCTWLNTGDDVPASVEKKQVSAENTWSSIWKLLYQEYGITSLLVEGGTKVLQSIADEGVFDQVRIITSDISNDELNISSPSISGLRFLGEYRIASDTVRWYEKKQVDGKYENAEKV